MDLARLRNIGISAHIDSGKTTLSERILFYTGRIHRMQEVHDSSDGGGATMDHMELERERGITITSAATQVEWSGATINLIDTPGHVDFTVEVERSLRVLDGAILVLCAVGGVQAQSLTIDRQMRRYHVPRLAFINKMDRVGADPEKVIEQLRAKLDCDAMLVQLPIGREADFRGVIDLVTQRAIYFDGPNGEEVRDEEIPAEMVAQARAARHRLLEALSMYSDELMEILLAEEEPPVELIHGVLRSAVAQLEFTPVLLGSAYRNKGVQPLLDAVVRLLPSPLDGSAKAFAKDREGQPHEITLVPDPEKPTVAMAFKMVEDPYGTLTFMRLYQGRFVKGGSYFNQRTGRKERFSRIVRMHADQREDIDEALAGDIVAVLGVDCASGDTYCSQPKLLHATKHVRARAGHSHGHRPHDPRWGRPAEQGPAPLPSRRPDAARRDRRGDGRDPDRRHGRIAPGNLRRADSPRVRRRGRGRRAEGELPRIAHPGRRVQYPASQADRRLGPIRPRCRPARRAAPGRRPRASSSRKTCRRPDSQQFIPAVEKGFRSLLGKGPIAKYPVVGLAVYLEDGSYHEVDSSDLAFQICARRRCARRSPERGRCCWNR